MATVHFHAHKQISDGQHSILTKRLWHGSGMAGLSGACHSLMPHVAADAADNGKGLARSFQNWSLFDVQFEIDGNLSQMNQRSLLRNPFGRNAHLLHQCGQRLIGQIMTEHKVFRILTAEQSTGTDAGLTEPCAFFSSQNHQLDRFSGGQSPFLHPAQANEASNDASGAIEITAVRNGIQMRAAEDKGAEGQAGIQEA